MLNSEDIRQRSFRSTSYRNVTRPSSSAVASVRPDITVINNIKNEQDPPRRKKKIASLVMVIIAIVIVAGLTGFFAWKYFTSDNNNSNEETTAAIIGQVGKLFALPEGEEPTVAQIQDKEKLKDQEFFERARNDDYLLVYEKARMALLYRQSENRLINVGPVSLGEQSSPETQLEGQVSGEQTP